MAKTKLVILVLLSTFLITGCWDKVEINERAFISAVGIDDYKGEGSEEKKYIVTYVYPNLNAIGKNGQGQPRFVISSVGQSTYDTTREIRTRINKVIFFQHMKVLVIGEDAARNNNMLRELLDSLERHSQVNRKVNVLIAKGKAEDVLNLEPEFEPVTGTYISDISRGSESTARFSPQTLGDVVKNLHENGMALMPRVVTGEKDLKVAGSAVIKDHRLLGWLGEKETRGAMFLMDKFKSDVVTVTKEINKEKITVPYIITSSKTKLKVKGKEGNIKVDIPIQMEGYVQQFKLNTGEDALDNKFLESVEKVIEEKIKKEINVTIEKLQKEFKADVIGIGGHISKYEPDLWDNIKDNWGNIFPEVDINVSIEAKIRRIGLTK